MKIMKKLKDAMLSTGVAIMAVPGKIFAESVSPKKVSADLYGPGNLTYIEPEPTIGQKIYRIWKQFQLIIVPIILIIGIITYCKKSKKSVKNKVVASIIMTILAILVMVLINIVLDFVIGYDNL